MPIGFTGGDGGASKLGPKTNTPAVYQPVKTLPDFSSPVWPAVRDVAQEAVAAVVAALIPVTVEVYTVRADGRACSECGPYDGSLWDEGDGPQPPLHPNCRCRRLAHHTEWRTPR